MIGATGLAILSIGKKRRVAEFGSRHNRDARLQLTLPPLSPPPPLLLSLVPAEPQPEEQAGQERCRGPSVVGGTGALKSDGSSCPAHTPPIIAGKINTSPPKPYTFNDINETHKDHSNFRPDRFKSKMGSYSWSYDASSVEDEYEDEACKNDRYHKKCRNRERDTQREMLLGASH